jgi:hypothetical protein
VADKIYVIDPVTEKCELKNLTPYPTVGSTDSSITVNVTADTVTGQKNYDVVVTHDINMDNVTYTPSTMVLKWTESDGDTGSIDLSTLQSSLDGTISAGHIIATHHDGNGVSVIIRETVTSLSVSGAGVQYTDEAGNNTVISLCELSLNTPDNGNYVGG